MKNKFYFLLLFFLPVLQAMAQPAEPEMADALRSSGKIFVVLACVLLVLAGMVAFLLVLEKRISRLEKQKHEN